MTETERMLYVGLAALFGTVVIFLFVAVASDYRGRKDRAAFMSQCIEKWAPDQCLIWDHYKRRDLAFR
jgi:hypothetical protein